MMSAPRYSRATGPVKSQSFLTTPIPMVDEKNLKRIWGYVYDGESLNSDPATARDLADTVSKSMETDNLIELQRLRNQQVEQIKDFLIGAAQILVLLFVAAVISWVCWMWASHNDHDYAGYGPSKVPAHSIDAIQAYYGQNDLPRRIKLERQFRGWWLGRKAWESQYRLDNKPVCVYVWNGYSADVQAYAIQKGACL